MNEGEEEKTVGVKAATKAGRYDTSAWGAKNSLVQLKPCSYVVAKDAGQKKMIYLGCSSSETFTLTQEVTEYNDQTVSGVAFQAADNL